MEKSDLELITELLDQDEELAGLWSDHLQFEKQLEEMNNRPYLTDVEQVERKRLQKLKLAGRDKIEAILSEHREKG